MSAANPSKEDEFTARWDPFLLELKNDCMKLERIEAEIEVQCIHLEAMKPLFKKLIFNKSLIPEEMENKDRAKFFFGYVRNYAACILLAIDDILLRKTGRILTVGHEEEVVAAGDLDAHYKNNYDKEYAFEKDKNGEDVKLTMTCVERVVKFHSKLKKQWTVELKDLEGFLRKSLDSEQKQLKQSQQRALYFSPFFWTWFNDAKKNLSEELRMLTVQQKLDTWELRVRDEFKELGKDLHAMNCTSNHKLEFIQFTLFDVRVKLERSFIDTKFLNTGEKLALYRNYIEAEILPDTEGKFAFVEAVLEKHKSDPPELSVEQRRANVRARRAERASRPSSTPLASSDDEELSFETGSAHFVSPDGAILLSDDGNESDHCHNNKRSHKHVRQESSSPPRHSNKKLAKSECVELDSFLHNADLLKNDANSSRGYAQTITYNGKNLATALKDSDRDSANVLCDAIFESLCVDDVCEDMRMNIVREQNVVAFSNLKRMLSGCVKEEVVKFNFNAFFARVYKRAYDKMKIVRQDIADGGGGSLLDWESSANLFISRRLKISIHRVKLKCIFIDASLNDQVDTLDLSMFKKCGFLNIYRGVITACTIPLTKGALLQITGNNHYSAEDMDSLKKETLATKVLKSSIPSLKAVKEEKLAKKQERVAEKKEQLKAAEVNSPADARDSFIADGPIVLETQADAELNRLVQGTLADTPLAARTAAVTQQVAATGPLFPPSPSSPSSVRSTSSVADGPGGGARGQHSGFSSRESSLGGDSAVNRTDSISPVASVGDDSDPPPKRPRQSNLTVHSPQRLDARLPSSAVTSDAASLLSSVAVPAVRGVCAPAQAPHLADVFLPIFRLSQGVHDSLKVVFLLHRGVKWRLALLKMIKFALQYKDLPNLPELFVEELTQHPELKFELHRAFPVDADDQVTSYSNTKGDGFCVFRATLQAFLRSEDPTISVKQLQERDWRTSCDQLAEHIETYQDVVNYANPQTHILQQTKLDECLYNAQTFLGENNPAQCWGDIKWTRFLPFDVALLDFSDPNNGSVTVRDVLCKWGVLATVPFHYFKSFFGGGKPRMSVLELREFAVKSNYIGYNAGHSYVLPNPADDRGDVDAALLNWAEQIVSQVLKLSPEDLQQLDVVYSKCERRVKEAAPAYPVNTCIGVIDVTTDVNVPIVDFDSNGKPLCCDTLEGLGEGDRGFNKQDVDDIFATMAFLRGRVEYFKEKLGGKTKKSKRSRAAEAAKKVTVDLSGDIGASVTLAKHRTALAAPAATTTVSTKPAANAAPEATAPASTKPAALAAPAEATTTVSTKPAANAAPEATAPASTKLAALAAPAEATTTVSTEPVALAAPEATTTVSTEPAANAAPEATAPVSTEPAAIQVEESVGTAHQLSMRKKVTEKILERLIETRPPSAEPDGLGRFMRKSQVVENDLFNQATSFDEYADLATLNERMRVYALVAQSPGSSPDVERVRNEMEAGDQGPNSDGGRDINEVSLLQSQSPLHNEAVPELEHVADAAARLATVTPSSKAGKKNNVKTKKTVESAVAASPTVSAGVALLPVTTTPSRRVSTKVSR